MGVALGVIIGVSPVPQPFDEDDNRVGRWAGDGGL